MLSSPSELSKTQMEMERPSVANGREMENKFVQTLQGTDVLFNQDEREALIYPSLIKCNILMETAVFYLLYLPVNRADRFVGEGSSQVLPIATPDPERKEMPFPRISFVLAKDEAFLSRLLSSDCSFIIHAVYLLDLDLTPHLLIIYNI